MTALLRCSTMQTVVLWTANPQRLGVSLCRSCSTCWGRLRIHVQAIPLCTLLPERLFFSPKASAFTSDSQGNPCWPERLVESAIHISSSWVLSRRDVYEQTRSRLECGPVCLTSTDLRSTCSSPSLVQECCMHQPPFSAATFVPLHATVPTGLPQHSAA